RLQAVATTEDEGLLGAVGYPRGAGEVRRLLDRDLIRARRREQYRNVRAGRERAFLYACGKATRGLSIDRDRVEHAVARKADRVPDADRERAGALARRQRHARRRRKGAVVKDGRAFRD